MRLPFLACFVADNGNNSRLGERDDEPGVVPKGLAVAE
jgi:hypothetical protein